MVLAQVSSPSSSQRAATSVRWVAISSAVRSSNSKTFWMKARSSVSMAPFSQPTSTVMRISSSLMASSSFVGSMPSRRSTALVETVSSQTTGAQSLAMAHTRPDIPSARGSALRMARRLGTSSPKTSVT